MNEIKIDMASGGGTLPTNNPGIQAPPGNGNAMEVGQRHVLIKVPRFLPFDVDLWETQCLATFNIHGLYDETQRYYQTIAALDADVIKHVTAYISHPRQAAEFSGLVEALKQAFAKSDGERMDELFSITMNDMKPSMLYYTMRRLWLDKAPDESKVLRHIFIRKLPSSVSVLLRSITNIALPEFLKAADDMVDQYRQTKIFPMASQVDILPDKVDETKTMYPVERTNVLPKYNKNEKRSDQIKFQPINKDGICNYHARWGDKAFKCREGCKYVQKKNNSVNAIGNSSIRFPTSWHQRKAVCLQQKVNGKPMLVDTGSTFSLLPARSFEAQRKPNNTLFKDAQGAPIPVFGQREITVDIGFGRSYKHLFFIAGVQDPLLGLDFLLEHRLAVDPVHERLIDVDTYMSIPVNTVIINSISATGQFKGKFQNLWKEFPSLSEASIDKFVKPPNHSIKHDIEVKPGTKPASAKVRRLFGEKLQAAKNEIELMLKLGIIQESKSEWASPLHVVPKGEGSYRPCGDFRQLNASTVGDKYPIPHVQDFTRDLDGAKIFSKIDLVRAFHQIPLAKEAIAKTAIITPLGLYEFLRMPFGLCNAAQTFQRFMDIVVRGLEGVFVYIDDILVIAENDADHEQRLRKLFSRLSQYGLVVNPSKSILGAAEVNFLGFTVNAEGLKPMTTKVKAVTDFAAPTNFGQLCEFLGMVNFYHRFIPHCSSIASPLYDLLKTQNPKKNSKKTIPINLWKREEQKAFDDLKQSLADVTTLAFPNPKAQTRLVTDASDIAVGAVLEQEVQNNWCPIAFYSKCLKGAELRYSTYDRELLAVKLSLQHFRHIVEGIPSSNFHVATDHKPLTTGKSFTENNGNKTQTNRVARTWQVISELTTDIRYISGQENAVADALSRNSVNAAFAEPLISMIAQEQEKVKMRPMNLEDWPPHWDVQKHFGHELTVDTRSGTPRPVIPESLCKTVFDKIHGTSHMGVKATRKAISASFVWPNMAKQITQYIRQCHECQASKITKHTSMPYKQFDSPAQKFEYIHVDIVGPLPKCNGYSYLLTIVDRFSRWPAAIPLQGITAQECASALITGWIQHYGTPLSIATDRGRQFISSLWKEICQVIGATHDMTTSYHPQSNGLVERFHRQLKACLMAKMNENERWFHELPIVILGIRTAVKEDLGMSSAHIVYGQPLRLPNAFFPERSLERQDNIHDYVRNLEKCMHDIKYTSPSWHGNTNENAHVEQALSTCSYVYVLESGIKKPLQRPYKGPFKVIEKNDKVFSILLPNGKIDTVSVDRLKPAHCAKE